MMLVSSSADHNFERDELQKYMAETRVGFIARVASHPDYVRECIKREYAKASPDERNLMLCRNPFEIENDAYDGSGDEISFDQSGPFFS